MALAVFLDAIGQATQAPIFLLLDLAAFAFDNGLEVGGQSVHLLRADILARDQKMLVESHLSPFPLVRNESAGGSRLSPWLVRDAHHAQTLHQEGPGRPQPLR